MFGFLKGPNRSQAYRQTYARCCAFQHLLYGVRATPVLSYEAVFLYGLVQDMGAAAPLPDDQPNCCRLCYRKTFANEPDAWLATYCAAAGILLFATKVEDDQRDGGGILSKSAAFLYRRAFKDCRQYLNGLDSQFVSKLDSCIAEHLQLESSRRRVPLDQYTQPTENAFGLLFSGVVGTAPNPELVDIPILTSVGRAIGGAIVAFDCAVDWERDERQGQYNPLGQHERIPAMRAAQRRLAEAGWVVDGIRPDGIATSVIGHCFSRVESSIQQIENKTSHRQQRGQIRRLARSGTRLLLRRGDCDIPCDCLCEGCCAATPDCPISVCDADGAGCEPSCCHCADCCDPLCGGCGDCGDRRNRSKPQAEKTSCDGALPTNLVGTQANCSGSLRPSGIVLIDGIAHPAKSEDHRHLPDGAKVTVIRQDSFGLVVRAEDNEDN